jgi:hypothetical protein
MDPSQMSPDQALSALLDETARRIAVEIRTHVPGTIVSYSRATGRAEASVRVDMKARMRNGQTFPIGQVDRCPVLWPAGGGWCHDADLSPGDEVCVVVFDRDISEWLESGGEADPLSGNLHSISNAAVLAVSLRSKPKVGGADPGAGAFYLGREDGSAPWMRLKTLPTPSAVLEAPAISLGDGATLGIARITDAVSAAANGATLLTAITAALTAITAIPANAAAAAAAATAATALSAGLTGLGVISGASTVSKSL